MKQATKTSSAVTTTVSTMGPKRRVKLPDPELSVLHTEESDAVKAVPPLCYAGYMAW